MRAIRQLLATLEPQPSTEHVQAAMRDFAPGELSALTHWAADKPEKIKRRYFGDLAAVELQRRKDLIASVAEEAARLDEPEPEGEAGE